MSCGNGESFLVTARVPRTQKVSGNLASSFAEEPNQRQTLQIQDPTTTSVTNAANRAKIVVSSEIDLPFSSDIAFDAFADLRRQPVYSTWLNRVEYLEGSTTNGVGTKSKWTISFLAFRFSWHAISLRQDREAGVIEWGSISGLKNQGCVQFTPKGKDSTHMRLTMTIFMPRFAARMAARSNNSVARMIEKRMLRGTLTRFRDDVVQNDLNSPLVKMLGNEPPLVDDTACAFRPVVPQD